MICYITGAGVACLSGRRARMLRLDQFYPHLKLFVYLTDVDHGSGPHAYVMQSHRTAAHFRARPYCQRAIDRCYGHDQVHSVLGARGTAFMADTYGIHAGTVPARAPRLILQAQYSLLPVFAFDYEAVKGVEAHNTPNLDPYVTRLLIEMDNSRQAGF